MVDDTSADLWVRSRWGSGDPGSWTLLEACLLENVFASSLWAAVQAEKMILKNVCGLLERAEGVVLRRDQVNCQILEVVEDQVVHL